MEKYYIDNQNGELIGPFDLEKHAVTWGTKAYKEAPGKFYSVVQQADEQFGIIDPNAQAAMVQLGIEGEAVYNKDLDGQVGEWNLEFAPYKVRDALEADAGMVTCTTEILRIWTSANESISYERYTDYKVDEKIYGGDSGWVEAKSIDMGGPIPKENWLDPSPENLGAYYDLFGYLIND